MSFVDPDNLMSVFGVPKIFCQTLAQSGFHERIPGMKTHTLGTFTALQRRSVSGWPLRMVHHLDTASPHFHSHVLTASELKRQSVFAAVAEMAHNARTLAEALGAVSGVQCRDPLAQSARSLVLLKPAQVLRAIYNSVPDALLGTLKRVGPDPFSRLGLYRDLFRLFAEPEERERADLIRHYPGKLTEERLEIALVLDSALLHQRVFERVTDLDDAEQANAAVRLIRATVSTATTTELRRSVSVLPQVIGLSTWAASWLRRLDRPLAAPPALTDPDLIVLGVADLRAASMQLRNCLRERVLHVATGRDCYVVSPGAVAELRRTSDGRWVLFDMWGPGNERPDERIAGEMRRKLEAAGVVSLAAAVPQADLEPLAEFFNAFDLLSGWPTPGRARHRLQARQEAA
nr:hypothetical protein [Tardiphaga sp. vice352]